MPVLPCLYCLTFKFVIVIDLMKGIFSGAGSYYCSGNDLGNFSNVTDIPKMAKEGAEVLR